MDTMYLSQLGDLIHVGQYLEVLVESGNESNPYSVATTLKSTVVGHVSTRILQGGIITHLLGHGCMRGVKHMVCFLPHLLITCTLVCTYIRCISHTSKN